MTNEANQPALSRWLLKLAIGRRPKWTLIRIAVLVVGCFVLFGYVLLPIRVQGMSMMPNYQSGHIGLVNRLAYRSHGPHRGDVVSIRYSGVSQLFSSKSAMLMKRVVGLPGETVAFVDGRLLVNGQPLDEPYVKYWCAWQMPPRTLGPEEYFVVGDNRTMSIDEHEFGAAARSRIVGKVLL